MCHSPVADGVRAHSARIRKVKCDEDKPCCRKCVSTGRTCDGYESPFRLFNSQVLRKGHVCGDKSVVDLQSARPGPDEIAFEDIELLNRSLSTKTIVAGVELDCNQEVRQVLHASLTDPSIRHAILSLKTLRNDLEALQNDLPFVVPQDPNYAFGTQQYGMALKGLVSNLSSSGTKGMRSALFCCQIFISIEQLRANYSAMAQHIIAGLKIMQEYRIRRLVTEPESEFEAESTKVDQLPSLDVFVIKLFAAPCKFEDPPAKGQEGEMTASTCPIEGHHELIGPRELSSLRPKMRAQLTKIATLMLEFLSKISKIETARNIALLLPEKIDLLDSLESWHVSLDIVQRRSPNPGFEPISFSFMRMFHSILKIVLLGALDSSTDLHDKLQMEHDRLQSIADLLGERVKSLRT